MESSTIEQILGQSLEKFREYFGSDVSEFEVFNKHVLNVLKEVYKDDPKNLDSRLNEIIEVGYKFAPDLIKYLKLACVEENGHLTYNDVSQIVNEPLKKGDLIYHFSHKMHKVGYTGHKNMWFNSEDDHKTIETDSITFGKKLYSHKCEVIDPHNSVDHHVIALLQDKFKYLKERLESKIINKEYETISEGAIKVFSVRQLSNRELAPYNPLLVHT